MGNEDLRYSKEGTLVTSKKSIKINISLLHSTITFCFEKKKYYYICFAHSVHKICLGSGRFCNVYRFLGLIWLLTID